MSHMLVYLFVCFTFHQNYWSAKSIAKYICSMLHEIVNSHIYIFLKLGFNQTPPQSSYIGELLLTGMMLFQVIEDIITMNHIHTM